MAVLGADGMPSTWVTVTPLPVAEFQPKMVASRATSYLVAGDFSSVVYQAPMLADGTLGAWSALGQQRADADKKL